MIASKVTRVLNRAGMRDRPGVFRVEQHGSTAHVTWEPAGHVARLGLDLAREALGRAGLVVNEEAGHLVVSERGE
jgi:hypothetical protein